MTLLRAKCAVLGDPTVGKSAVLQVFQTDDANFPKSYNTTLGVDTGLKVFPIPEKDSSLELHFAELSGHDVYSEYLPVVLEASAILLIVFDVTSELSLKAVESWIKKARDGGCKFKVGALVGNKSDLEQRRVVSPEEGKAAGIAVGLPYFEVSAKTSDGVKELFNGLALDYFQYYQSKLSGFQSMAM